MENSYPYSSYFNAMTHAPFSTFYFWNGTQKEICRQLGLNSLFDKTHGYSLYDASIGNFYNRRSRYHFVAPELRKKVGQPKKIVPVIVKPLKELIVEPINKLRKAGSGCFHLFIKDLSITELTAHGFHVTGTFEEIKQMISIYANRRATRVFH